MGQQATHATRLDISSLVHETSPMLHQALPKMFLLEKLTSKKEAAGAGGAIVGAKWPHALVSAWTANSMQRPLVPRSLYGSDPSARTRVALDPCGTSRKSRPEKRYETAML